MDESRARLYMTVLEQDIVPLSKPPLPDTDRTAAGPHAIDFRCTYSAIDRAHWSTAAFFFLQLTLAV